MYKNGDQFEKSIRSIGLRVVTKTLKTLRSEGCVDNDCFEDDLYLGVHFADAGDDVMKEIIEVSKNVNSPERHSKLLAFSRIWLSES